MASASAPSPPLKRVKTYLRSTTGDGKPNHLMLLHVHKELADGIDKLEVANMFVGGTISGVAHVADVEGDISNRICKNVPPAFRLGSGAARIQA